MKLPRHARYHTERGFSTQKQYFQKLVPFRKLSLKLTPPPPKKKINKTNKMAVILGVLFYSSQNFTDLNFFLFLLV